MPSGAFGALPRVPEAKDLKDPHELSLEAKSSGNKAQTTAKYSQGRGCLHWVVAAMWIQHTTLYIYMYIIYICILYTCNFLQPHESQS